MVSAIETADNKKEHGTYDGNVPVPPVTVTSKTVFIHPQTHPIVLALIALQKYGVDWLEWEPETVQESIQKDYGNISDLNFSKLMAMKTLHLTDGFWKNWELFVWVAMPLNGIFPDFDVMQVPTVAQCSVAVEIADHTRRDVSYSSEVKKYLEIVHLNDSIFVPQAPLDALVANVPVSSSDMDTAAIKTRWPDVRRTSTPPTGNTANDEQLRLMLQVFEHLEDSRSRLRAQLPLLQDA